MIARVSRAGQTRRQAIKEGELIEMKKNNERENPMLPRCAICGEEVKLEGKDKGETLGDGNAVCQDCYESSALVVTCDECEKDILASNGTKDADGTLYCPDCFRQAVVDADDFIGVSFEDWAEDLEEDQTASLDEWTKYMREHLETAQKESMEQDYYISRKWMKIALEETEKRIEAARVRE
jgi:hypothetical protein